jgi:hypothetical protein
MLFQPKKGYAKRDDPVPPGYRPKVSVTSKTGCLRRSDLQELAAYITFCRRRCYITRTTPRTPGRTASWLPTNSVRA